MARRRITPQPVKSKVQSKADFEADFNPHSEAPMPEAAMADQQRPSRSARKRQAEALQVLGVRLTRLTQAQLLRLALPEELLAAILAAQGLRSRAALARQRQYIGRLMRQIDPEPIERALTAPP